MNLIVFPNILRTRIANTVSLGPLHYGFVIIYVVWIFCLLATLLLMVLPSSYAASKAESTAVSVCKYLNVYLVPDDMKQLELFVLQLHKHKVRFSICGVVDLQISTVTKMIGTIITYLLIFIQLQNK
ncbi:uncharacterized protein LOC126843718 [Adelges cooleyi]|uniref:uncharacterized protein LOC126843718 n=1 Tax=Adelges cooleyi TaxID=133065 RepID=UPI00217F3293|nr:uncharacterized protein LOC126843718 [Adelges cooleyi]